MTVHTVVQDQGLLLLVVSREKGWIPIMEDLNSDADTKARSTEFLLVGQFREGCFKAWSLSLLLSLSSSNPEKDQEGEITGYGEWILWR